MRPSPTYAVVPLAKMTDVAAAPETNEFIVQVLPPSSEQYNPGPPGLPRPAFKPVIVCTPASRMLLLDGLTASEPIRAPATVTGVEPEFVLNGPTNGEPGGRPAHAGMVFPTGQPNCVQVPPPSVDFRTPAP